MSALYPIHWAPPPLEQLLVGAAPRAIAPLTGQVFERPRVGTPPPRAGQGRV